MTLKAGKPNRRNVYLAALTTALISLGGCGGDSDSSSDTSKPAIPDGDLTTPDPTPEPVTKALVIGIDGLMYDYIDQVDNPELNEPATPNFGRLTLSKAFAGGLLNTATHQASYSGPSWSSILTGTWTDRHGVTSNNSAAVAVDGIFSRLDQQDPTIQTGSFAAWTPINSGHMLKEMAYVSRRVDGASRPADESLDEFIANQLVNELEYEASPLRFIFTQLDEVDGAGHGCGWCATYENKLVETDAHLGRILDAIDHRERTLNEEWLVMVVSDHGHRPAGGHGGDTVVERTSVIGVNKPALFNEFFSTPAEPLPLSEDPEQNTLMGYPGITAVVPTVMTYLGYPPQLGDNFDSPSLVGDLGAYKLYSTVEQSQPDQANINLTWQNSGNASLRTIYRDDTLIAELSPMDTTYQDVLTKDMLGEGTHNLDYTVVSDVGSPVSSHARVSLAEPVSITDLLAERESLISFDNTTGAFSWVQAAASSPSFVAGPFNGANAVNLQRSNGYLSQAKDFTGVSQYSIGFRLRVNGNISGDPNVISNKNWASGYNKGFLVTVSGSKMKLNVGDGSSRADTSWTTFAKDEWVFVVASIDLNAKRVALYIQDSVNGLQSSVVSSGNVNSMASPLPLNIGEGGDGSYNTNKTLNFDMADLVTFNRALTEAEVRALANTTAPLGSL
ncbi:alkaline phosphatase family protein [Marinobacter zhejiangensis]|uniref:Concanavalin A-like lectin/glucanases superfamily protein n=1 Tax=Marinobacter zhejiangensis TaxID=488535 RepID=A0A1I4Q8W6_9GAMM|nr:alkaline phosphatase family protein [Marinobacter zhejiangensis]SFM36538.1 Concanavalin A-like lectin/glucanases superfamily protein [Marinobacter zhejiangensis]